MGPGNDALRSSLLLDLDSLSHLQPWLVDTPQSEQNLAMVMEAKGNHSSVEAIAAGAITSAKQDEAMEGLFVFEVDD